MNLEITNADKLSRFAFAGRPNISANILGELATIPSGSCFGSGDPAEPPVPE